jgi:perosamine synthetase
MNTLADQILTVLKHNLPVSNTFIPLHEPIFQGNEQKYLQQCLTSTMVSSIGPFVDRFEQMLAEYTGTRAAVCTVNGTSALHICLKLANVVANDEVLVPALTFVATANAVVYCSAIPHFIDSEERTLGINPQKLYTYLQKAGTVRNNTFINNETGRIIRAVIAMHTFGHPVDLDPLIDICKEFHINLIEDAAESLGSFYKGRHTGNWGILSALSFNGNKIITTGGGGAIITNDEKLGKIAKHLTTTARIPHKWQYYHDQIGYNYRLPNINAALGCAQMERLDTFIMNKRLLAEKYSTIFQNITGVSFFKEPTFATSNYWLNALILDSQNAQFRDTILELINNHGIMIRPAWTLLPKLSVFNKCPQMDLSVAQTIESRLINIPSSANLLKK